MQSPPSVKSGVRSCPPRGEPTAYRYWQRHCYNTIISSKMQSNSCKRTPQSAAQAADSSRVVEKSVNSVSAFGAKSSVHFLAPPFPTEPACAGLRRGPQLGELMGCAVLIYYLFFLLYYFLLGHSVNQVQHEKNNSAGERYPRHLRGLWLMRHTTC